MLFCLLVLRSLPNGNCLFGTAYFSLVGDNSLVHELGIMAGVELHLNASYARHPALKSLSEKIESVIGGKLFSFYRIVSELAQGLQDSKTSHLNCLYEALIMVCRVSKNV